MAAELMIQAEGLKKRYGETEALAGVDFSVPAGTILGLLGPNGAGKTTAVRILTTLAVPDAGTATVAGIDVVRHPGEVRRHIGVAAQDATLDPLLTGRQNLVLVGELSDMGRAASRTRAAELLERFELTFAADRVLKGYSGGMKRRLDLAASMMTRPPVLFLDEPTTGLDPVSRQRVWDAIRELLGEGVTVLLTTQYLEEADELASRIVVIDHGLVIANGTPTELKEASRSARLEVMLSEASAAAVPAIAPLVAGQVHVSEDGRHLSAGVDASSGLATAIVRALDAAGVLVDNIEVRQPSLDDVFFTLTGGHIEEEGDADGAPGAEAVSGSDSVASDGSGWCGDARVRGGAGMTTTLAPVGLARPRASSALTGSLMDIWAMTRRNLVHISREPMQLSDVTLQPLLFTILFVYIFGGAIPIPGGGSYVNFLLAGILALNLVTSTMGTAVGLSTDLHEGMIDRFRALPMWRSAVLVGRSMADLLTSFLCALIVALTGLAVGWRPGANAISVVGGFLLMIFFAYSISWVTACAGLNSKSPESAASFGFIVLFPLTFVSNSLVPTQHMPGWLQAIATWNPVSAVVAGARVLWGNPNPSGTIQAWPMQHPVEAALIWSVAILAVAAPWAAHIFKKRTTE